MGYNHGKAEKEWEERKKKKLKLLQEANCSEDQIKSILDADRKEFLADRRYGEKVVFPDNIDDLPASKKSQNNDEILTIQDIFDHISDPVLLSYLKNTDCVMLNIILLKTNDYEVKDIADELNMTKNAVYKRIKTFRKKLPK